MTHSTVLSKLALAISLIVCAYAMGQETTSKGENFPAVEALHGGWRTRVGDERLTLTIDKDGTYWVALDTPVGAILSEQGKWRLEGRHIVFTVELLAEDNPLLQEMLPMEMVHEIGSVDHKRLILHQRKEKATDTFHRNQTDTFTRTNAQPKEELLPLEQAKAVLRERQAKKRASQPKEEQGERDRALSWYTTDDGMTWFADDARKISPFERDGKTAYRCYVYSCDDGKTMKVAFLEKYEERAKQFLENLQKNPVPEMSDEQRAELHQIITKGILVKPPGTGDEGWVRQTDPMAPRIVTPKCPEGGQVKWVAPE